MGKEILNQQLLTLNGIILVAVVYDIASVADKASKTAVLLEALKAAFSAALRVAILRNPIKLYTTRILFVRLFLRQ